MALINDPLLQRKYSSHISLEAWMEYDDLQNQDWRSYMMDHSPNLKRALTFGFPNERMTRSGDYICHVPGLADIAIHKDFTYVIWRLMGTNKVIRTNCDGLLQALGIVYQFFKDNDERLPPEVRSLMEKLEQEEK